MKWLDALVPSSRFYPDLLSDYSWTHNGNVYPTGAVPVTTYGVQKSEPLADNFRDYASGGFCGNGVISSVMTTRLSVFAEARFQFQQLRNGRPGDLFGTPDLDILEHPGPGLTTGDMLTRQIMDADLGGNGYQFVNTNLANLGGDGGRELVRLRPDYVEIVLGRRVVDDGHVGYVKLGFGYYEGGKLTDDQAPDVVFPADEVAHFAPRPDPLASYRGCSWLTPVVREVMADSMATGHKVAFFEHGATPNMKVTAPEAMTFEQFTKYKEIIDADHGGWSNAYKTLYLGGGLDATTIGLDFKQMDFEVTQGAGETRIAAAGGIHPVVLGFSASLRGSALNAGNYQAAKRATADRTFRPLWRNMAGSLEVIVPPPQVTPNGQAAPSRLWYDDRDVAFLREDEKDRSDIKATEAQTIRNLLDAGFTPDSAVQAVLAGDWARLVHTNLFSVQLQAPGSGPTPTPQAVP